METYKIFTVGQEIYFTSSRQAAKFLEIDEMLLLCLENLHLKHDEWWIDRGPKDLKISSTQQNEFDWKTPFPLKGGKMYDYNKPLNVFIKIIGHHIDNDSSFGRFLKRFTQEFNKIYKEENLTEDITKEDIEDLVKRIGTIINVNGCEQTLLLEIFNEIIDHIKYGTN